MCFELVRSVKVMPICCTYLMLSMAREDLGWRSLTSCSCSLLLFIHDFEPKFCFSFLIYKQET